MPIIKVVKSFLFDDGVSKELKFYALGEHEVPEAMAAHPYVQAHLEGYISPDPPPGSMSFAQKELLAAQAARMNEPQRPDAPAVSTPPARAPAQTFAGRPPEQLDAPAWLTPGAPR